MKLAFVSTTLAAPPVVKAFSARISSIVDASKLLRLIFDATAKGTVVLIFHVDGLHVGCLNLPEFTCAILVIVSSLFSPYEAKAISTSEALYPASH